MQRAGQHAASSSRTKVVLALTVGLALVLATVAVTLVIPSTRAATPVQSVRSGAWSDASTWSGGHVPQADDPATIAAGTTVTVAGTVQAAG
jgi:asparagine N-glycosylation enzyme membrane subunit Stt3